ncbi:MAG: bifunctional 5,10-methylenetetrahydrofolate dehydrogenase/5,10-methenyltetrahydrofolate cyclohydrolase [Thermoplasmatota archaeon]
MCGKKIDGRKISDKYEKLLKNKIEGMNRPPSLHTIFAGEDEGSKVYLGVKNRGCKRVGIETETHRYGSDVSREEIKDKINELNNDHHVDGILIQMPLPGGMDATEMIKEVDPQKDVEGMHPVNLGRLMIGDEYMVPCTPKGIITMFEHEEIELEGKEVCVVSHSNIVGKPMAILLLNRNATINVVHVYTEDLKSHTLDAEIIIAAAGVPHLIKRDMVAEDSVIIDVGMNRLDNGELVGDVEYDDVKQKVSKITPVPGGVGPTTVLSLLENTYKAARERRG